MPTTPIVQAFIAFALATCGAALWKGGPAERVASFLILVNISLWMVAEGVIPDSFRYILQLTDDGITAIGLLVVTVRYGSPWLGVAMLLYGGQFALHAYYFVMELPSDNFHAMVNNLDFMGVILCLAFGTAMVVRRRIRARDAARAAGETRPA